MNTKALIAQHLSIVDSAIVRIEEWANCLFVVVKRLGARFVSKKIMKTETYDLDQIIEIHGEISQSKDHVDFWGDFEFFQRKRFKKENLECNEELKKYFVEAFNELVKNNFIEDNLNWSENGIKTQSPTMQRLLKDEILKDREIMELLNMTNFIVQRNRLPALALKTLALEAKESRVKEKKAQLFQIKTGSEHHSTERRGCMVEVNGEPIYKVLTPTKKTWDLVGNKGKHGKWCIAEYLIPTGAKVSFKATANGKDPIVKEFVVDHESNEIDIDGFAYNNSICGWIVAI